jgi:HEAT repeat protein
LDDSSYTVVSSALRSLTKADSSNAAATLTRYLNVPSWRNGVSNTALSMLATLDSSKAVTLALEDAGYGNPVPTRFVALAILSKYGKKKPEVLSFYGKLLSDKNSGVKSTAVKTLGDIGDESAIPALQRVADDKGDADAGNALSSIEKIKKKHAGKD